MSSRLTRPLVLLPTVILSTASTLNAAYTGLTVERFATVRINSSPHDVWRVYGNFSSPTDQLNFVFGSVTYGTFTLQSRNGDDSGPGPNFYNSSGGAHRPPTAADIAMNPNNQWDSFFTIGISIADQGPYGDLMQFAPYSPGPSGNMVSTNDGGWYCVPELDPPLPIIPNPQTQAGFLGDGDPLLRVLIIQLTLPAGNNVRGTVNISTWEFDPAEGITIGIYTGQTFNSVPGPGALAVTILAGIALSRRRRTEIQVRRIHT